MSFRDARDRGHFEHHREHDYGRDYRRDGPPPEREPEGVDRERTCPFLVPVFVRQGDHSPPRAYHGMDGVPSDASVTELHIYTWEDATLLELAELVRERLEDVRTKRPYRDESGQSAKRFPDQHFCLVYPDREGAFACPPGLRAPCRWCFWRFALYRCQSLCFLLTRFIFFPHSPLANAGIHVIKGVGWVKDGANRREREEKNTLRDVGFVTGDYLDIMYVI